jgi:hypothetical protein
MRRIIPFIIIITLAALFNSCDKPTKEKKESDARFQKITRTYTLNPDGSMDYQYQHELDLYTHFSFNRLYGETFIVYNPEHQELKVNRSETKTAEGKMVPSPDNAFNEVLPRFAEGAPPYHQLREMVVTHTGLEKNSTIFLDYNLHTEAGYKPFLMEDAVLSETSPVNELVIKVRFPKDKELNYQLLNAEENLNISNKGDMKEYKWVFKDLDATSKEDQQPAYHENLPRLLFSTTNLEQATSWLMDQFSYDLPASIGDGVKETLQDKQNKMDSILAIRDMVANHINHFDIPPEYKGYTLHSNEQVLENNGGTTFEKTVLLASMLRKIGVEANPVAIIPDAFHSKEMGNLKTWKEYYVQFHHQDKPIYLSAIHESRYNNLYEHAGEAHLLLNDAQGESDVLNVEQSVSKKHLEGSFTLSPSLNIQGDVTADLSHCENPYLQMEENEEAAKSVLSPGFPAASLSEYTVDEMTPEQSGISYKVQHRLSPDQQNGYRFISIPLTETGLDHSHLEILTAERESPFAISWPIDVRYQYTINLPESMELVNEGVDIEKSGELGEVTIQIQESDDQVTINRHLRINKKIISPANYQMFREMISLWQKDKHKSLVLKDTEEK